jgi:hypothetical protein
MLRNYFKITSGNIIRHKAFSIINISGMAIGIASGNVYFNNYCLDIGRLQGNKSRAG